MNPMKMTGIVLLVVALVCVFVAVERYQANASNVAAVNAFGGGMMKAMTGGQAIEPATPAATKYAALFAVIAIVGGVTCLVKGAAIQMAVGTAGPTAANVRDGCARMRSLTAIFTTILLLFGFEAAAGDNSAAPPRTPKVILDTDLGFEDYSVLAYLLDRPDVDILAVTVAGMGEVHGRPGVRNVHSFLALAGRRASFPVACGGDEPERRLPAFSRGLARRSDRFFGEKTVEPPARPERTCRGRDCPDPQAAPPRPSRSWPSAR